jgi:hypothetical protein
MLKQLGSLHRYANGHVLGVVKLRPVPLIAEGRGSAR